MKNIVIAVLAIAGVAAPFAVGQGMGSAGSVSGIVTDPSGGVVRGVAIELQNRISGYDKTVTTDDTGAYHFLDLPPNNYHLSAKAAGFSGYTADLTVRGSVPVTQPITMTIGTESTSIDVSATADLVESAPTPHTEVDTSQFENLPT